MTLLLALLLADPGRPTLAPARWPGEPRVAVVRVGDELDVWCSRPMTRVAVDGRDADAWDSSWPPTRGVTVFDARGLRRVKVWSVDERGRPWAKWFSVDGRGGK